METQKVRVASTNRELDRDTLSGLAAQHRMTEEEINSTFQVLNLETEEQRQAVLYTAVAQPRPAIQVTLTHHTGAPSIAIELPRRA